jgi:hypothetical protein
MILESKSLLAKLMATENLVIEQRKVHTALFDTENRVLIVPILDNNIPPHTYDLFMGHEVGHALWTPPNGSEIRKQYDVPHSLANVVEDSRIERKIKQKYPGLKHSFVKGYQDLMDRNFFGTKGQSIDSMKFIDRLNIHCKGGALLNIHFTDDEKEIVKMVESTETYEDVMTVCQKIIEFVKESAKNMQPLIMDHAKNDDSDEEYDTEEVEVEEKSEEFEENGSEEVEVPESEDEKFGADQNKSSGAKDPYEDVRDLLESDTEASYKQNEQKLFSEENREILYVNIPKLQTKDVVLDYKTVYADYERERVTNGYFPSTEAYWYDREGFLKIRDEIKTGVSYLVKEFEMRKSADQLKKASTSKTGDLNLKKLYSHAFNEDIFKRITVMPGAKSHGLVIFLDWSGSMTQHIKNTVKQLFNIVMFCKKVNIPYEVYTFTSVSKDNYAWQQNQVNGDLICNNFKLMNILSHRMSASEFTKASEAMVSMSKSNESTYDNMHALPNMFAMGGTPLNSTIIAAMELIPEFQKKNNLQIVNTIFLTDGDSDPGLYHFKREGHAIYSRPLYKYNYSTHQSTKLIVRDPVNKNSEVFDMDDHRSVTSSFIKLLKQRIKCNVVGFYILSPKDFRRFVDTRLFHKGMDTQSIRSEFSKNHCAVMKTEGYDEYYLLRSDRKDSEEPELEVKENASNKVLANAFIKYNTKRSNNRVVLNRFINLIA